MRIYFDACCLNRPFDDQTIDRNHLEAEAVLAILGHIGAGEWQLIGSEVLDREIEANPEACAESGKCDVFLTTDDVLQKRYNRVRRRIHVRVENPLKWLTEQMR